MKRPPTSTALRRLTPGFVALLAIASMLAQSLFTGTAQAANVVLTAAIPSFTVSNIGAFQLNGSAALANGRLRLTDAVPSQSASAFWQNKSTLANARSFSSYFSFEISNSDDFGADGLTFAIQTVSNTAGSEGAGIGIAGVSPSVAVEFDTYYNPDEVNDPNGNHVGLDINGNVTSVATAGPPNGDNLEEGIWHAWVDYQGADTQLQVRMSRGNDRNAAALVIDHDINLSTVLTDPDVFLGFTSATGGSYSRHEVLSLYFANDYLPGGINLAGSDTYSQAATSVSVTASQATINSGGNTTLTITATDATGAGVEGQTISLSSNIGSLSSPTVVTDDSGVATATFTSSTTGTATIRATASGGVFGATTVTVQQNDTLRQVTSSPLTLHLGNNLQAQIDYNGNGQIYYPTNRPGNYGTSLAVGTTLYGFLGTGFTPVSLSSVSGSGTSADPYKVTTVVNAGATGLRIEQTDFLVNGQEAYRTDVRVVNTGSSSQSVMLYRSMDCYLGGSDSGYSTLMDANIGSVACTKNLNNSPPGNVEQLYPLNPANYVAGSLGFVYNAVLARTPLPNAVESGITDNGQGISWSLEIPAAGSVTRSHLTNFSPSGGLALQLDLTPSTPTVAKGGSFQYTLSLANPYISDLTVDSLSVTLPQGFSYVADSSSGVTTANPTINGQVLTWTFSPALPASGVQNLVFAVRAPETAGSFGASATATTSTSYRISGVNNGGTITVLSSSNNSLSILEGNGTSVPNFNPGTTEYSVNVPYGVTTYNISAITSDSSATVSITPAAPVSLTPGSNVITVRVTAEDGSVRDYTITVNRAAASTNADLSNLTLSAGTLSPAFSPSTTSYSASVASTVSSVQVNATAMDSSAVIFVNGVQVTAGNPSGPINLKMGENTITVLVRAEDNTEKSYTVTVTRALSSNNLLSTLTGNGTAISGFDPATLTYQVNVANDVTTYTLAAVAADPAAQVTISPTPATLEVGSNPISVIVTAEDGSVRTYTVIVNRAPSADRALSSLTVSSGTLSPAFNAATTDYLVEVANNVSSITVTPTTASAVATVSIKGTTVTSGQPSAPINLAVGANVIEVTVQAQNGETSTYTITVVRAGSANATLQNLTVSAGTLTPVFSPGTTSYSVSVPGSVETITVTPTVDEANATVKVNGQSVTSGQASFPITLAVGQTTIDVTVTAQNGTLKTYTITVERATPFANADLVVTSAYTTSGLSGVVYTITAKNLGPDAVHGARLSAPFPAPAAGKSWTWTCTAKNGATCVSGSGVGNLDEMLNALPKDGEVTFTVTGSLNKWSAWTMSATVSGPSGLVDPTPANNSALVGRYQLLLMLVRN